MHRSSTERLSMKKTAHFGTSKDEENPKNKRIAKEGTEKDEVLKKPSTSRTPRPSLLKPDTHIPSKPVSRITSKINSHLVGKPIEKSIPSGSKLTSNKVKSSKDISRSQTKIDSVHPSKSVNGSSRDLSKESRSSTIKKVSTHATSKRSHGTKTDRTISKQKTPRTAKDLPFSVTVNSPISTRKLTNPAKSKSDVISRPSSSSLKLVGDKNAARQRGRTITLKEDEIKVCSSSYSLDNNEEMRKLSTKLSPAVDSTLRANPQAFFVDLDGNVSQNNTQNVESDEESYEDDFENYESDFDSYNSSEATNVSKSSHDGSSEKYESDNDLNASSSRESELRKDSIPMTDGTVPTAGKQVPSTDEERMLDSGSYELREAQKSAAKVKTSKMDEIRKAAVEFGRDTYAGYDKSKVTSLTDEGFIEMHVSGTSSVLMKSEIRNEIRRPAFIDLKRSRETNRLRIKREKMAQRAKDLLAMITLDQISYTLLDIPPISYDVFMKMHGKGNSIQRSIQTNDDWISEEIQTDIIHRENKWTQYPIEFSKDEIYLSEKKSEIFQSNDLFEKAKLFLDYTNDLGQDTTSDNENILRNNPLRIFIDQRKGSGSDTVLSRKKYDEYLSRAKNVNEKKLNNFIDRAGNLILRNLDNSSNSKNDENVEKKCMKSDWPFSESYEELISNDSETLFYLKNRTIRKVLFSQTSTSHILTVHSKPVMPGENNNFDSLEDELLNKCLICIWESEGKVPRKVLTVCDGVAACVYRGKLDGMVFAALDDGSLCIWDLKERPCWHQKLCKGPEANIKQNKPLSNELTKTIADRDWNEQMLEKSPIEDVEYIFRTCTFSSSAMCRKSGEKWFGSVVSLVFKEYGGVELGTAGAGDAESIQGILGQLHVLQEYGFITIWSVFETRESTKSDVMLVESDTSAYWSKINLNKSYEINLQTYIDVPIQDGQQNVSNGFNLIAAKRRNNLKRQSYQTAILDSNGSVSSRKISVRISPCNWECGVLCTDLKILTERRNVDVHLVARNCGEVIGCRTKDGGFHIQRFKVTDETNTITSVEISPLNSSYFLAGTNTGTICLFAINESRTLLTLNCKTTNEKAKQFESLTEMNNKIELKTVWWLKNDACSILTFCSDGVLRLWDFMKSDIHPMYSVGETDGLIVEANLGSDLGNDFLRLAVLTSSGRLEVHKLLSAGPRSERHDLFAKYAALL